MMVFFALLKSVLDNELDKLPKERDIEREKSFKLLDPGSDGNLDVGAQIIGNAGLENPKD